MYGTGTFTYMRWDEIHGMGCIGRECKSICGGMRFMGWNVWDGNVYVYAVGCYSWDGVHGTGMSYMGWELWDGIGYMVRDVCEGGIGRGCMGRECIRKWGGLRFIGWDVWDGDVMNGMIFTKWDGMYGTGCMGNSDVLDRGNSSIARRGKKWQTKRNNVYRDGIAIVNRKQKIEDMKTEHRKQEKSKKNDREKHTHIKQHNKKH